VSDTRDRLQSVIGALPGGGESRPGQAEMADAVASALLSGRHLVAQAGTGTGKSLAYLVPAILSQKRVVVATATKALQDQLADKDLPFLRRALKRDFTFAVLKGRSNYLCVQRAGEVLAGGEQGTLGEFVEALQDNGGKEKEEDRESDEGEVDGSQARTYRGTALRPRDLATSTLGDEVRRLVEWGNRTATGDRAELEFEPRPRAWSLVSVTSDECPGARQCPSGDECFAERARALAGAADVVVVNMHLYGAHLASEGTVLPEHDAVVFDEAHQLEDILAACLGAEIAAGRLRRLAASARSALAAAGGGPGRRPDEPATEAVEAMFTIADRLEASLVARMDERLPVGIGGELADVIAIAGERAGAVAALMRRAAKPPDEPFGGGGADPGTAQRSVRALLALEHLQTDLRTALAPGEDDVVWIEGGSRAPVLRVAPIDVSPVLSAHVFGSFPVVLTTATAPPGLAERLGASAGETDVIDAGSPFPYQENALLYCAAHLPRRRGRDSSAEVESAMHDEIATLVEAAGGRTMALFTSWRAMQRAADAMRSRLPFEILAQGDLPKSALVEAFSSHPESCLFATMSFWQGVDVTGPTLSLLVIDKIPFPRPDDPLMSARRDRAGRAAFTTIDLPRAATLLAQGAGRLIRSVTDRGVVAVLDPRLATAAYRWTLVNALPPMRRTKDRAVAVGFLRELRGQPAVAKVKTE
jgi:ATP-dependent DNA helicase DinG